MSPEREARLDALRKLEELCELVYSIQNRAQSGDLAMSVDEIDWLQTVYSVTHELISAGRFTLEAWIQLTKLANDANRSLVK